MWLRSATYLGCRRQLDSNVERGPTERGTQNQPHLPRLEQVAQDREFIDDGADLHPLFDREGGVELQSWVVTRRCQKGNLRKGNLVEEWYVQARVEAAELPV